MLKEIRIHGRGGQGAVTSGQLLAIATFYDGRYSQSFPMFGVERCGAPVQAFARISDSFINVRSQVYEPDFVIVLDPSLIGQVDVTAGLKKGGTVIVNTNKDPKELGIKGDFEVHCVDGTNIALQIFKKPIVNTPMLGAFSKISGLVSLKSLRKAVDELLLKTKGAKVADLNKKAIEEVFNSTR